MGAGHLVVVVTGWLIAAAWLGKLVEASVGLPKVPNLVGTEYDVAPMGAPRVVVIVPARNEKENVGACLRSLIGQDYEGLRVIAVDDRSTDGTGAILREVAERHRKRVEVIRVEELPAAWLGKPHAMALAAERATAEDAPDYLLFTDADILFRVDAVRRAVAYAEASRADHFVLLPTTIAKTWGEAMLLSYIQVMSLWAVRPWQVANPKAKRDAVGVGAFNLIRTEAYQQLGGFAARPMEIIEDLTLGRRVKEAGLRQRVAIGPGMVSVHWAAGAWGIVHGLTKNMFAVFGFRPERLLAGAIGTVLFCVVPLGMLAVRGMRLPGMIVFASAFGLYDLSSRASRISPWYAALEPLAASLVVYSMLRSMCLTVWRGGVMWRGTFYSLAALREHVNARSES
jgi:glycosyltransferase involved in cell wall biosynthesis